jgi:hypothetical protein
MAFRPTTAEGFVALWKLLFPESYTSPIELEGDGEGQDIPEMMAKVWEKVELSVNDTQQSYFLKAHSAATGDASSGATKAAGSLELRRVAPMHTPVFIAAGTGVRALTTSSGPLEAPTANYVTTEDVTTQSLGPVELKIEAVLPGFAWNLEGPPDLEGYGKGTADSPKPPFPGSPYGDSPTPWYRWEFIEGVAADPTDTVISAGGSQISGDFNDADINRNVFVFTAVPQPVDVPRVITSVGEGFAIIDPPLPGDGAGTWRPATFSEMGITLTQDFSPAGDITGGSGDTLDSIGSDRRIGRADGEGDEQYRGRICSYPDIVTPNSIRNIISSILDPCGIPWSLKEVLPLGLPNTKPDLLMGFTWDTHPYDFGELKDVLVPVGSEYEGQGGVYLPRNGRIFFILVDEVQLTAPVGLAYDDGPYPNAYGSNAYDGNVGLDDPEFIRCVQELWTAVNGARAAGVSFVVALT